MRTFAGICGVLVVVIGALLGYGVEIAVLMIVAFILYMIFHG
jgi:hypothetical protein